MNNSPGETDAKWVDRLGKLWADAFENINLEISNTDYLIVACAGNENSGNASREADARYQSPMANIACRPALSARVPNFITVESVRKNKTPAGYSNYDWLGTGDSVAAGGSNFITLEGPGFTDFDYDGSGTSYSTPMISGMASFLWSLDPELSVEEVKYLLTDPKTTQDVNYTGTPQATAQGTRANLADGFAAALGIDNLKGDFKIQKALVDVDDGTMDGNLRLELTSFSEDPDLIYPLDGDGRRGDRKVNMKDFRAFRDAWLQVIGETEYLDGPPTHFKRDLNFDGLVENQPASPPHPAPYTITPSAGTSLSEAIYSRYDYNGNGRLDVETQMYHPSTNAISPFKVDPDTENTGQDFGKRLWRDIDVLLDKKIWEQDEENVLVTGSYPSPGLYDLPPVNWSTNTIFTLSIDYLKSFDLHVDMEAGDPDSWTDEYLDHPVTPIHDGLWIKQLFSNVGKARSGDWQGVITFPFVEHDEDDFPAVAIHYKKTVGGEFHQYSFWFQPKLGEDIALVVGFDELQFYSNTREFTGYYLDENNVVSEETIAKTPMGGTYGGFFISYEEYSPEEVKKRARDFAVEALADRLKFPVALNGSPAFEPIYRSESMEGGSFIEIYGIVAQYNSIAGTKIAQ